METNVAAARADYCCCYHLYTGVKNWRRPDGKRGETILEGREKMEPRETTWNGSEKMDAPTEFPSAEPSSLPAGKMAPDGISVAY